MDACKINGIDIMSREDVENLPISDTAKANLMIIFEAQGCFDRKQGSVEKAIDYFKTKRRLEVARMHARNVVKHESTRQPLEQQRPEMKLTDEEAMSGRSIIQILKDREATLKRSRKRIRPQSFLLGKR